MYFERGEYLGGQPQLQSCLGHQSELGSSGSFLGMPRARPKDARGSLARDTRSWWLRHAIRKAAQLSLGRRPQESPLLYKLPGVLRFILPLPHLQLVNKLIFHVFVIP